MDPERVGLVDHTSLYETLRLVDSLKDNLRLFLERENNVKSDLADLQTKLRKSERAWDSLDADYTRLDKEHNELRKLYGDLEISIKGYRIVALLDGDGAIFSIDFIERGIKGGHDAAERLLSTINDFLRAKYGNNPYQVWVKLFLNKRGLMDILGKSGHLAAKHNFEEFLLGLNQASDRFLIVDVGGIKEAADSKIKAHLEDDLKIPQTFKVIFGGCHDNGYVSALRSHITDRYKDKLVLLQSYDDVPAKISELDLPIIPASGVFLSEKLFHSALSPVRSTITSSVNSDRSEPSPTPSSPLIGPPPGLTKPNQAYTPDSQDAEGEWAVVSSVRHKLSSSYSSVAVHVPRREPQVLKQASKANGEENKAQLRVDPTRPLAQQNFKKPFCNHFYLNPTGCRHGSDCHYSHEYIGLSADHYEELKINAKKNPCPYVNEGEVCPWDTCIYGHVCPTSPKCPFYAQGRCKFTGAGMHKDSTTKR